MTLVPWRVLPGGLEIRLKVIPKAAVADVVGMYVDARGEAALKVKVRAVPENGAANVAVCKLLAVKLGCAPSALSLKSGQTSSHKVIWIQGEGEVLVKKCEMFWGADSLE